MDSLARRRALHALLAQERAGNPVHRERRLRDVGGGDDGTGFTAGTPQRLFQLPRNYMALSPFPGQFIDVTRDNQRFMAELPVIRTPLDEFTVVLNWPAGVTR
jgi:hypothetical protein